MKQYKEDFTNPDTGKKEKIQVTEYFFEDYVNGIISVNFHSVGKQLCKVTDINKKVYYEYNILSSIEYKKIQAEAKRLYNEKVNNEFNLFKTIFSKRYDTSQAKDLLLKNEIELYNKLLFNEYLPIYIRTNIITPIEIVLPSIQLPDFNKMFAPNGDISPDYKGEKIQYIAPTKIDTITISEIRETYKRIIIEGVKDYSQTNSPNFRINVGSDHHYIRVEAIHLYFEWLKDYKPTKTDQNRPEAPTFESLFICENKAEVIALLKENYIEAKSKNIVMMLKALKQMDLISIDVDTYPKTDLYNLIVKEFNHKNSLSAFTENIRNLENDVNDEVKPTKRKLDNLLAKLVNK